jgi:primosomal protein N' (replication factor Y)
VQLGDGVDLGGINEEFHVRASSRVGLCYCRLYPRRDDPETLFTGRNVTQAEFYSEGELVGVLTAQPINRVLDYKAPEGGCWAGAFVEVPLGPRKVVGVVWAGGKGDYDRSKIRSIIRVLDVAPMREEMQIFLQRAADYTLTPLSAMLRLATRAPGLGDPPSMQKVYRLGASEPDRMTDARTRVLAVLEDYGGLAFTLKELAEAAGVTTTVVKGLVKQGAVLEEDRPRDLPFAHLDPAFGGKTLTGDQEQAALSLRAAIQSGRYGTTLLRGVTGSGKTEVYLEAVAECLRQGRQALVLLPEIALTAEFLTRVQARFGAKPAEWHSGVTMTERRRIWKMVGQGGAQMVIGARSALFLPFQNLGLVVVDEEHDTSYKQEDGVLYNARDMAVLRASICGARVVLASATPSLESWTNAEAGKYDKLTLTSRFGEAVMPDMRAIDMRGESLPSDRWISGALQREVKARVERGEQALLFINRRGYAPITLCRACGHQIACDHCDARMVEHRFQKRLVCHQCGESAPIPETCPNCGAEGRLAPVGPGVERLTEEAQALFPDARVVTLSSDLYGSARALKAQIEDIAAGGADIIIGTQLVAKGHNFPLLTLVGVIDADLGLQGSDLRAAERTFQLMRQVAGRAGRSERKGLALLQTYQPEHPVIRAIIAGDEDGFWRAEAEERRHAGVPPFGRMAGIILSSPDVQDVFDLGNDMARRDGPLRQVGAQIFGPAPAPIARIRGRHRVRLLVKADKGAPLQAALTRWLAQFRPSNQTRISVDIDPQTFY